MPTRAETNKAIAKQINQQFREQVAKNIASGKSAAQLEKEYKTSHTSGGIPASVPVVITPAPTIPTVPTTTTFKPSGAMISMPTSGKNITPTEYEEMKTPAQRAKEYGRGFYAGLISPLTFLGSLGTKSPTDTLKQIGGGIAYGFSQLGVQQIKEPVMKPGEQGFQLGASLPILAIGIASMKQPTIKAEIGIVKQERVAVTDTGVIYKSIGDLKIISEQPFRGARVESTAKFGEITDIRPYSPSPSTQLFLSRGAIQSQIGKQAITEPYVSIGASVQRPTEAWSFGVTQTTGVQVRGVGITRELSTPREYGYAGISSIKGVGQYPVAMKITDIIPSSEGTFIINPSGGGSFPITVTSTGSSLPVQSLGISQSFGSTAASALGTSLGSVISKTAFKVTPYISMGIPAIQLPRQKQSIAQTIKPIQTQIVTQKIAQEQIISQKTISGQITKSIQGIGSISRSMQGSASVQAISPISATITIPIQTPIQRSVNVSPISPIFSIPPNVIMPPYGGFNLGFGGFGGGKSVRKKQPKSYQPSLRALTFGIKSVSIPKFSMTGIGLRPILSSRKRKRKK